jgi:hypothetical protein
MENINGKSRARSVSRKGIGMPRSRSCNVCSRSLVTASTPRSVSIFTSAKIGTERPVCSSVCDLRSVSVPRIQLHRRLFGQLDSTTEVVRFKDRLHIAR